MRLALDWLREHCAPDLDASALADRLAMTGTAVERVLRHGVGDTEGFVVGRVLDTEPHPDADRLAVCRVALGAGEEARIVCGAPNVRAGQTVAVARPGAVMPDGTRLKAAKLRGVTSQGMILAEDELGIGTGHEGILVLDSDGLAPGAPLLDALPIATDVLELEITPNRPDCLGVYGLAREVHAVTGAPLGPPPWAADPGCAGELGQATVTVSDPEMCPRFVARVFSDVRVGPSPPWLKARLMAAGQRPISNVVDVTNYVMLLAGHPLHAFDLDRVAGARLDVRRGRTGEELVTLDGARRDLDEDMVVICDGNGPASLAGVMGGERCEVSPTTTRVLLEAAVWDGPNIQRTSTRLDLRSEASARFEKGLSPGGAMEAQALATALMVSVCGARVAPGTIDVGGPGPAPATVALRPARLKRLLGAAIAPERCAEILAALGFAVGGQEDALTVTVPHWRAHDVTREADLIEEVARVDGLERLPATLPSGRGAIGRLPATQRLRRRAAAALADRALCEVVGWSFANPDLTRRLRLDPGDERACPVRLANPLSEEDSVLRTLLLGSVLDVARHNAARGARDIAIFEQGAVYLAGERDGAVLPREPHHLAVLITGAARPATWREPEPPAADVFAIKGLLAGLLDTLRVAWQVRAGAQPFLHPGRAADVLVGQTPVGWLGELHPGVAADWDLGTVAALEIDLDAVGAAVRSLALYRDLITYPAVRQDLAVVVSDDVPAARVVEVVRAAGGATLREAEVFDVYRGAQVAEGRASLALRLSFQAADRTLTDAEVARRRERIAAALADELGGELRA